MAINEIVGKSPSNWQIGITNDPSARKEEWARTKNVAAWKQWQADSLEEAQAIERHFIHVLKMNGGTGGNTSSDGEVYVYIF